MPDWFALLPEHVARHQIAWERQQSVLRARKTGITLKALGEIMGVCGSRVRQLEWRARTRPRPPVETYFEWERTRDSRSLHSRALKSMALSLATHNQAQIDIGGVRLRVQIADTPALRERGLSGRSSLAPLDGMLFVFDKPSTLWMKGMLFPLDIIWISSDGNVADVTEDAQPQSYPHQFSPRTPAQYAVEVPAGFVRQHHISVGDRVSI